SFVLFVAERLVVDFLRCLVRGDAEGTQKASIVGRDLERLGGRCPHRGGRLARSSRRFIPADESHYSFEAHSHLVAGCARTLAAGLHLRVVGNCRSYGVGQLPCEPVDVVHQVPPPHRRRAGSPGPLPIRPAATRAGARRTWAPCECHVAGCREGCSPSYVCPLALSTKQPHSVGLTD